MKYILLISFLFLTACGMPFERFPGVDPALLSSVQNYASLKMQYLNQPYNWKVEVVFGDIGNHIGLCRISSKKRIVIINAAFWNSATDSQQEQLMLHEMAHCDLGLDHTSGSNIMNSSQLYDGYYVTYRNQLIEQLFLEGR